MNKITWIALLFVAFLSCGRNKSIDTKTTTEGNVTTTTSTDPEKLSRWIDIREYRPRKVKFKHIVADNSAKAKSLSVPGPSSQVLEAILYFDTETFERLKKAYFQIDYPPVDFKRDLFYFDWLDKDVKEELLASDKNYHGHPDYFFAGRNNSVLWFLKNKVLLFHHAI